MVVLQSLVHLHGGVDLASGPTAALIPPGTSAFLLKPAKAAAALAVCFAIVWFLPNTQEILGQAPLRKPKTEGVWKIFAWTPNLSSAAVMIALFTLCFAYLDASKSFPLLPILIANHL